MTEAFHPVYFDPQRCRGRRRCLRVCPTEAVRIRSGHAEMIPDRCIDCGECITNCDQHAVRPITDPMRRLSRFDRTIALPSMALYTQLDVSPSMVFRALRHCGFTSVASLSPACDEVTVAMGLYLAEHRDHWPLLASDCPAVVRLVQARYPELVDNLLPLLPPREIAARDARERTMAETGLSAERIGVVFITPCPAKMVSIVDHPSMSHSHLDAAVSIAEIFPALRAAVRRSDVALARNGDPETASGMRWAWVGGRSAWLSNENSLSVAGLSNVIRILDDLEEGRLTNYAFISAMACVEGCVSGPLTVENPYVARARAIRLTRSLTEPPVDRGAVEARYRAGGYLADAPFEPQPAHPLDEKIEKAIAKMRRREDLLATLPGIDCGACGAPSCRAFADDVVSGAASRLDCIFLRVERRDAKEQSPMTVADVVSCVEGRLVAGRESADQPVRGGYVSDLLSDVMANARDGDLWVTLQRHANIVAVASVRDLACIVLVGGRQPEEAAVTRAEEEGVPIIVTALSAFDVIGRLHGAGLKGRRD